MLLEISAEKTPERMKGWSQSKKSTQLWMWLVIEARSNAVKNNIAKDPGIFSSVAQSCPTLRNPVNCSTPGLPVHHHLPEFTQTLSIKSVMPSSHLILCRPLLLLLPIPPSMRVFSNESTFCMRWPKCWSFSFSIIPSKEHPGLIFRMDWLDLFAIQGTLKTLLQHYSSKASIFWCSAFFTVKLSHPYMTTGKPIALTRWTFVGKVMSLLLNMLSRLVITPSKD